jgi:hypothetical protein
VFASAYGTGYGIHHNRTLLSGHDSAPPSVGLTPLFVAAAQRWNYISHQLPSEAIFLRCYDSWQGRDGKAKFGPHVAGDVTGEKKLELPEVPRTSIEVRLVVLHR